MLGMMQEARIVQIAFGDQMNFPAEPLRQLSDRSLELRQKVARTEIVDSVNRVQAQRVEVIVLEPVQCVFDEESPHIVAFFAVKVDGLTPGSAIAIGKVWAVSTKVVAFRAEMVVNHVERDGEAMLVGRVYQPLQGLWAAVGVLRREEIDAVVAPIARTGKLGDRHQFNRRNPQGGEFRKMRDYGVERSFRCVGSDMEFIEDAALQSRSFPVVIGPAESVQVDDLRRTMHSLRLKPGSGIGQVASQPSS